MAPENVASFLQNKRIFLLTKGKRCGKLKIRLKNSAFLAAYQQNVLKLWKKPQAREACEYSLENLKKVAKKLKKSVDK